MTKDISAMAFWKAAGPYSEGDSHRFTDSPIARYAHRALLLAVDVLSLQGGGSLCPTQREL